MALKTFKPVTPSLRQLVQVDRTGLWKGKPVKALTEGLSKSGGRNNAGRITVRHRGGGHKRRYRLVDFKRRKLGVGALVERLEYDPNRSAFIALLRYDDGEQAYILAPQRLNAGDRVIADERVDVKPGNAGAAEEHPDRHDRAQHRAQARRAAASWRAPPAPMPSWSAATATTPRSGSAPARSAGCAPTCMASIGAVSNPDHQNINLGKAGPQALDGLAADRARRRDEPGRPSARRRRGPDLGRPPPGHAVGQADQGRAHATQQEDGCA